MQFISVSILLDVVVLNDCRKLCVDFNAFVSIFFSILNKLRILIFGHHKREIEKTTLEKVHNKNNWFF